VNPLPRLLGYARPYRGRFLAASVAMVLYAAATAAVAALIRPLIDNVLPKGTGLSSWCTWLLAIYVVKGAGAYASTYLMTDIGQRVVRDLVGAGEAEVSRPGREAPPPPPLGGEVAGHPAHRVARHDRRPRDRRRGVERGHRRILRNWLAGQSPTLMTFAGYRRQNASNSGVLRPSLGG